MAVKYLRASKLKNKTVLVRGSVDVAVDEKTGKVEDDFRIRSFLPTVKFLISSGNKVVVCGKRGRPKGKVVPALSLRLAAECLADMLGYKFVVTDHKIPDYSIPHLIFYTGDIREEKHLQQIQEVPGHNVVFLENMEFYPEELDSDMQFAKKLASLAEVYVDDDFSKCHHTVASNTKVAEILPSYAGLLLEQEIKSLSVVLNRAKKPFVIMTGGVKLTEKVGALEFLGNKADKILVGGGVASLIFLSKGYEIGMSKIEEGEIKTAWQIQKNFKDKLVLPIDVVVADKDMDRDSIRVTTPYEIGKNEQVLDVGPKTILAFSQELKKARTIVWSGPLGMFEKKPFHTATFALSRLIGGRGTGRAFVVAGGGDTVDSIRLSHQFSHFDHVSTGGGAMLEFLAGEKLPGIEALK